MKEKKLTPTEEMQKKTRELEEIKSDTKTTFEAGYNMGWEHCYQRIKERFEFGD